MKVFTELVLPQGYICKRWTGSPADLPFNQGEEKDQGKRKAAEGTDPSWRARRMQSAVWVSRQNPWGTVGGVW